MAGAGLQCLTVMHQRLDRIGRRGARKFLLLRLLALDHRNRQHLLAEIGVDIQHLHRPLLRFLSRGMSGVTLLPQELTAAQERSRLLLPAHDRTPLVTYLRQITVRLHHILIIIAEKRLRRRPYAKPLLQGLHTAMRHPCHFRCKALHMVLLLIQEAFRNKHGQVDILHARRLKHIVHLLLDQLPDGITCRLKYHASFNARVV